ncbi:glycosyl hydrolase [Rufibacter radiotolerans]|uniref:glycosyl hydrolase n=1 Tax=Rufibacter radiotolerans TaxID=1379910 RepID=UPI00069FF31C|nr:glycosyl hydrolase [Rufibacter radiotolerans]
MTLPLPLIRESFLQARALWVVVFLLTAWPAQAQEIKLEAENATRNGVTVGNSLAGYSGTGYVQGFDNSFAKNVTFTVNAPAAGIYDLAIRYATPSGEKGYALEINGQRTEGMFSNVPGFATAQAGKQYLNAGTNTLVIGGSWGYYYIDFIALTPATIPLPAKPPKTLTDANATTSTKNLFSYLVDLYGTKVLAGQQENNLLQEIDYVREQTGKDPAIGVYDLIDYSPSRLQYGANPNNHSENAITWAKKDQGRGIISLMWHWNAPTDLINQSPDKLWWSGFYTRATTFDLAAALADKNGANYQLLLRDMDAIALELKKFQAQDIPVLWRPLHEAAGAWFWWGAKGAAPFKELWQIMHDRFTNHHQLHNLIWVYTAEPNKQDWYPGDAYVDIVGIDIYENSATASNHSAQWTELQTLFNGKKLVTLSETGNLPNVEYIKSFGTWWSWFAVWTGPDYIRKQPIPLLQSVFTHPDVITLDELPNWRTYGTLTGLALEEASGGLRIFPNPSANGKLTVEMTATSARATTFILLTSTGKKVASVKQKLQEGQNVVQIPVQQLPAGVYVLLVQQGKERFTRRVILQK